MPPRFKGPTYSCVRCGRVAQVFRLSLADLRSAGYEPCRPGTYVNWCGHAQEFIPWPTAEGLFFVRADSRGSFVSRRRRRDERDMPEQLILPPAPAASKARARTIPAPEQAARAYIARRAAP